MDELELLVQAILSLKDTTKSKQQILSELPKLEQQLQSDKNARVNIVAGLDIKKSQSLIQSQLNTLASQTKAPTIKVGVDVESAVGNCGQINQITQSVKECNQELQKTDSIKSQISIRKYASDNSAFIEQIKTLKDEKTAVEDLIVAFNNYGIAVKNATSDKIRDDNGNLSNLTISIESCTGEIEKFKYISQEVNEQTAFILKSVTATDKAVQKLVQSQIKYNNEQSNQFLKEEVKLLNDIFNTKAKIAKIKDDPNKSLELETQNSILSKRREELVLLRKENSEISNLVSQQIQNEYIIENTSKSRESLKLAESQAADKLVKSEKELAQQSEKTLAIEIKKSAQLERQIDTLKSRIATYKSSNPRAVKDYDSEFDRLIQDLGTSKTSEDVAKVRAEFETLKSEIKAAGKEGKTFWQTIKDSAEKFSSWMTLTSIISTVARDIKKMVTNVIELDSAMTNLKKVTDETETTYNRFLKNTAQQAKELHSTITDLIEQTSTWAKLGFNLSQSNVLAKASMIYSNVGEVDNEQAVTNIVSALKAFDIAAEDVMKIPDVYNKLGNEFAVSSKNLGSGIAQAATTMAQAGNDFGQVAAILTGAGEILGDNKMEEIGNGMKTVTLRIQNQAGALKELGEEYEDLISVSKTQQQIFELTNGTVNIMQDSDPNAFRSTYDILADIAEVIKDLNDTQASELIQLLFGKNRANVGTAVLKAFQSGQIQKAYEAAENSAGSAQKEFDKWSESIEAHINTMKSSFESLSNTVVNGDFIKGGVDFLTGGINLLDTIIDKLGVIPTLISAITLGVSAKNVGELNQNTPVYALSLTKCA